MAINAYSTGVSTLTTQAIVVAPDVANGDMLYWDAALNAFRTGPGIVLPTKLSELTNDVPFATTAWVTQQIANSGGGGGGSIDLSLYAQVSYVDQLFNSITTFDGSWASLNGKPTWHAVAYSGDYNDLENKPTLFSGDYNDLLNKPVIPSLAGYASEYYVTQQLNSLNLLSFDITDGTNGQVLTTDGNGNFSFTTAGTGSVNLTDLNVVQNAASGTGSLTYDNTTGIFTYTPPVIPSVPTNLSAFINDVNFISSGMNISTLINDRGYITSAALNDYLQITDITVNQVTSNDSKGSLTYSNGVLTYTQPDFDDYLTDVDWNIILNKPTTISGFGITDAFDGDYESLTNKPFIPNDLLDLNISDGTNGQILYTNGLGNFYFDDAPVSSGGGGGDFSLSDLSVNIQSNSGSGSLSYNGSTGRFTFTPPDLSAYSTFDGQYSSLTGLPTLPSDLTDLGITDGTSGQVLTTDGSGNFTFNTVSSGASAINDLTDVDTATNAPTVGQVLMWDGSQWEPGTVSGGGGVGEHIQWTTSGSNNELRISEQWLETGDTYTVRSVGINGDGLLEVELATFSPTVSATGQSLYWDQPATQFSVSVDNPTDFTSRYIDTVASITGATGVHSTLSDYTAGAQSATPAGGVDWTQTFSTNSTATIVSNGTGLNGGSASAIINFADDEANTWSVTQNISYSWQSANATISFVNLNGKNFLEKYTTVDYNVSITGLQDLSNANVTVTPTGGTLSNSSGSGTLTMTTPLHKDNNTGRIVDLTVDFNRPAGVTGSSYTIQDTGNDATIFAGFTYPSFYVWTESTLTVPTRTNIVTNSDFGTEVTELGNQAKAMQTTITNSDSQAQAFWFGVRSSASQPTIFQTGPSSALLSDTNVTTGNTVDLEPDTPEAGYIAEEYTLYGITLQPGDTYVRIN